MKLPIVFDEADFITESNDGGLVAVLSNDTHVVSIFDAVDYGIRVAVYDIGDVSVDEVIKEVKSSL